MKITNVALVLVATCMSACTTPQPALDQANHGAALTAALNVELRTFREKQGRVANARVETIKELESRVGQYERSTAFNDRVAKAAGHSESSNLYQTLVELADSISTDEAVYQKRLSEMKERLDALLQPLPQSAVKLATVQKALAALGAELSPREQIKIVMGFVSEVKSEIAKSKDAAEKAAKKAPVQPEPAETQ